MIAHSHLNSIDDIAADADWTVVSRGKKGVGGGQYCHDACGEILTSLKDARQHECGSSPTSDGDRPPAAAADPSSPPEDPARLSGGSTAPQGPAQVSFGGGVRPEDAPDLSAQVGWDGEGDNGTDGEGQQVPPQGPELDAQPLVDTLCMLFDKSVQRELADPDPEQLEEPPLPTAITKEERQQLGKSYEALLLKHGDWLAEYAVELNALFVTVAIFGPRLMQLRARIAWMDQQRSAPEPEDRPRQTDRQERSAGDRLAKQLGGL